MPIGFPMHPSWWDPDYERPFSPAGRPKRDRKKQRRRRSGR